MKKQLLAISTAATLLLTAPVVASPAFAAHAFVVDADGNVIQDHAQDALAPGVFPGHYTLNIQFGLPAADTAFHFDPQILADQTQTQTQTYAVMLVIHAHDYPVQALETDDINVTLQTIENYERTHGLNRQGTNRDSDFAR